MSTPLLALLLTACGPKCPDGTCDDTSGADSTVDSADSGETGESGDSGETGESGDSAETGESGETGETGEAPCVVVAATEEPLGGIVNNRALRVTLDSPGEVTATCTQPDGEGEERFVIHSARATEHTIAVHGLLAEATYQCEVAPSCGEPATVAVTTDALPADLPVLSATGEMPTPGYILFSVNRSCTGDFQLYLVVTDPQGRVRWYHAPPGVTDSEASDLEFGLVPGDRFLFGGGEDPNARPQLVDMDGTVVYTSDYAGAEDDVYHHDVEWTAEGHIVGLVNSQVEWDGQKKKGFDLVEQDPETGEVVWRWESQTAIDAGTLTPSLVSDAFHANALASITDADGPAYYVNLSNIQKIARVDRTTGDVTWTLGEDGDFRLYDPTGGELAPDAWFDVAHGLGAVDATHIVLYDNGRDESRSRALMFELAPGRATLVYEWSEDFYNPNWGDVQSLADGGMLVNQPATYCTGGTDTEGSTVILDAAGAELWRQTFRDRVESSYSAGWVSGCELFANTRYCPE